MSIHSLPSSASLSSLLPSSKSSLGNTLPEDKQSQSSSTVNIPASASQRSASNKQEALAIVERTLAEAYAKLGLRGKDSAATYPQFQPLTAEKVADNILGFIARRLQMDVAEGATQEQLESRLEAGLAGFKKGFAEASEKLQALSLLSPEIKQDIGKTYDLVLTGIEQLRQNLLAPKSANTTAASAAEVSNKGKMLGVTTGRYEYASASSFSFELVTKEGDRVTISATSARSSAADYTSANKVTSSQVRTSSQTQSQWTLQGDLNEQELSAINSLLERVNKLAGEFFQGDLDTAFNQALALGYDQEQISNFSLNLTKVEVQRVSATYQNFDKVSAATPALAEQLMPLGHFIKQVWEALDELRSLAQPDSLFVDLANKMIAPDELLGRAPAQRFTVFLEQLLAMNKTEEQ